ncbi:MAG: hypothetical protein LBS21_15665, partial [Clostridiales bacterium]|nr:hypothetical protein [Clostridiales bacterium]
LPTLEEYFNHLNAELTETPEGFAVRTFSGAATHGSSFYDINNYPKKQQNLYFLALNTHPKYNENFSSLDGFIGHIRNYNPSSNVGGSNYYLGTNQSYVVNSTIDIYDSIKFKLEWNNDKKAYLLATVNLTKTKYLEFSNFFNSILLSDFKPTTQYDTQYWYVEKEEDGRFYISNMHSDEYLTIDSSGNVTREINRTEIFFEESTLPPEVTIKGTLMYDFYREDYTSGIALVKDTAPLSDYKISIVDVDSDGSTVELWTTTTDSNGNFETKFDHYDNKNLVPQYGYNLAVQVKVDNEYLYVKRTAIDFDADAAYRWLSEVDNYSSKPVLNLGTVNVTRLHDGITADDKLAGAFNIYHWIKIGHEYYKTQTGKIPNKVPVYWEPGVEKITWAPFIPYHHCIELTGLNFGDQFDSSVILHEYGHFLMYQFAGIVFIPDFQWNHYLDNACTTKGLAFAEGWADFFSVVARNEDKYVNFTSVSDYYGLDFVDIPNKKAPIYFERSAGLDYSLYPQNGFDYDQYSYMEAFVASTFYDLMHDGGISFSNIDEVFMKSIRENPLLPWKLLGDFYAYATIQNFYGNLIRSPYATDKKLVWEIFDDNKTAYDILSPYVTIHPNPNGSFRIEVVEETGVGFVEWRIDGSHLFTWSSSWVDSWEYNIPSIISDGEHVLEVTVYDYAGYNARFVPVNRMHDFLPRDRVNICGSYSVNFSYDKSTGTVEVV